MAAEDDEIVAQLAVMCPDLNVALISGVVNQIKSSGLAAGNNELLLNLCLDRVLFGDPNDAMQIIPPTLAVPQIDNPHQPPMPGSSYNYRLTQIVESVASTSRQPETAAQGTSGQQQTAVSQQEQQPLQEIDPNKIVDASELDRYVNHVKDMFTSIDKRWINDQFTKGVCLTMIVEQIVNRPGDVPKEKKPEKKSIDIKKSPAKLQKNYLKDFFVEKPDRAYVKTATDLLLNEFRLLSNRSLIVVMNYFNNRYAPTLKILRNSLTDVNFRSLRGQVLPLNLTGNSGAGDRLVNLHMNMSQRPKKNFLNLPDELQLEVDWVKEHVTDFEDLNVDSTVSFSSPSEINIAELECQQKLAEARDRGEVYECAICCDELLIYEMVPCTDGHLFCTECLRNHAREIVFGQAKAAVTCLETDCKAGFARGTLEKALDAEWVEKLEERQFEEDVNCAEIENLIRCKFCNYAVVLETPVEQDKVFKCGNPDCERAVCRLCGADWEEHLGLRCEELENSDETKFRRETEEKMADAVIRRCHKCKAQLIKSDGCNKMTCRCGAKMCYICRKPDIDYNHFCNHARTPGQSCDKCKSCSLWEDANKVDSAKIEEIKKTIEIGQESLGTGQKRKIGVDDSKFSVPQPPAVRPAIPNPFAGAGNPFAFNFPGLQAQWQQQLAGPQYAPPMFPPYYNFPPGDGPRFN